jgi:hypothetical protein
VRGSEASLHGGQVEPQGCSVNLHDGSVRMQGGSVNLQEGSVDLQRGSVRLQGRSVDVHGCAARTHGISVEADESSFNKLCCQTCFQVNPCRFWSCTSFICLKVSLLFHASKVATILSKRSSSERAVPIHSW